MEVKEVNECFVFKDTPTVTWINIDCLGQVDILEKLGACYGFHPLVLEDILSDQRPKVKDYDDYIFVVLKMLYYKEENDDGSINADQVSLILGPNYVVSFKEKEADVFNPLRDRLRTGKGRIRKQGVDYLTYSMIDVVVDHYFVILEKWGEIRGSGGPDCGKPRASVSVDYLQPQEGHAVFTKVGLASERSHKQPPET